MAAGVSSLLAISWCLPPLLFPRSIQVARTLKYLQRRGWESTVVCGDPASMRSGRKHDHALAAAYAGAYTPVPVRSLEETLPMLALWRAFPALGLLPDARRPWMRPALAMARQLAASRRFDALASFAQPWSDHLVALRLKRETGLPWLAHFSDPWADSPYFRGPAWVRKRWRRWEADVVRDADALVFVTEQTADLVMAKYPASFRAKTLVVPHGFEADVPAPSRDEGRPAHVLRLVYTGNFFAGRTPDGLLAALAALAKEASLRDRLEVVLVGQLPPGYEARIASAGLGDVVRCRGTVDYLESQREAARADVLLLVDAPSDRGSVFLPSKLVDYLVFKKPILGLTPPGGASARLLDRLGCPVVPPDDPTRIEAALRELLLKAVGGRLAVGPAFGAVAAEYSMEAAASAMDAALRGMIATGEPHVRA